MFLVQAFDVVEGVEVLVASDIVNSEGVAMVYCEDINSVGLTPRISSVVPMGHESGEGVLF